MEDTDKKKGSMDQKQEKTWAIFCHLGALAGCIMPLGNVIGPLVIWLVKKNESSLINDEGKESLNFQISWAIYFLVSLILTFVFIGFILLGALLIFNLVMIIMAAIKVSNGEKFSYPLTIRFIK